MPIEVNEPLNTHDPLCPNVTYYDGGIQYLRCHCAIIRRARLGAPSLIGPLRTEEESYRMGREDAALAIEAIDQAEAATSSRDFGRGYSLAIKDAVKAARGS